MPNPSKPFILESEHLPNEGNCKGFNAFEQECFVLKKTGNYYVYRNSCPHMSIPLNWRDNDFLDIDGSLIQCASHGALFLIESGLCVSGPCHGAHLQALDFNLQEDNLVVQIPTSNASFT